MIIVIMFEIYYDPTTDNFILFFEADMVEDRKIFKEILLGMDLEMLEDVSFGYELFIDYRYAFWSMNGIFCV